MQRELYKQILINSYGIFFEKKSQEILSAFYGNKFKIIKPYGNVGDKKNDGYIPDEGIFFQIYGPEEMTVSSEKMAISKFKEDFNKLEEHCKNGEWPNMKKFCYIYNNKNKGFSHTLEKLRLDIEKNKNIKCELIGIEELMNFYDHLSEIDQKKLRGELTQKEGGDFKIYNDLKENFYESKLIHKLENFYFGVRHHINYFDLSDGSSSGDYIESLIGEPYYVFKNKEYETLRVKFCESYYNCMYLISMNYFEVENCSNSGMLETTWKHKEKVAKEFEKNKTDAVWALKSLLRKYYSEN